MSPRLFVWMGVLAGCAGAAANSLPDTINPHGDVAVEVRTVAKSDASWQSVLPGGSMASGTEFAISINATQPGFVYVGQHVAGKHLTLIHPSASADAGKTPIETNQPALLPAVGQWFLLDDHPGQESLLVLISTQPQELHTVKHLLGQRGDGACKATLDPLSVDRKSRSSTVHGAIGRDGLVVLCFPFRHVAPQ